MTSHSKTAVDFKRPRIEIFDSFIWAYYRLPEPKGRTYAELDILFDKHVSARKFSKTYVDPYAIQRGDSEEVDRLDSIEKVG